MSDRRLGPRRATLLLALFAALLITSHAPLLRLPYFWDEAGYYAPAARDLLSGSLIPYSTPSNAHPPLVLIWLALAWKLFGQSPLVSHCAMLALASFSLLGFFRLARTVANTRVAVASSLLVAIYPVFFAESSLAQVDLPAAGLAFWGLESYAGSRRWDSALWFSLAALAKETAILVPLALLFEELIAHFFWRKRAPISGEISTAGKTTLPLLVPLIPLSLWYSYHYLRTGYVFGNPEFFRYNVEATIHPLRIFLALLLRAWQLFGYLGLYLLTIACLLAMRNPPIADSGRLRPRILPSIQIGFLSIAALYLLVLAVIGGAVLARYMLPVVPLLILVSVSTLWRRLRPWKTAVGIVALAFVSGLFTNPPYGFSFEDNLAYRDYIRLHQRAEAFLEARYPRARVLTAWPATNELSQPYLGYVQKPMQVVGIEDFSAQRLLSAADLRPRFDVAMVFSTKYEPSRSIFRRWSLWQEWKSRYFGYHLDLTPEAAAAVLGGTVVYLERRNGQTVGIIELQKIEEASLERLDGKLSP